VARGRVELPSKRWMTESYRRSGRSSGFCELDRCQHLSESCNERLETSAGERVGRETKVEEGSPARHGCSEAERARACVDSPSGGLSCSPVDVGLFRTSRFCSTHYRIQQES
jgi:hypothetical protein